ncbi:MAG: peptidoglycan DD-metalloendopeptidase family protein [Flavobacteriales bacterium]|nr:peptidoglycan DD-metalloendopeptidase family protein [Flavobacteriales bacterium]
MHIRTSTALASLALLSTVAPAQLVVDHAGEHSGHGHYVQAPTECVSEAQREAILVELESNRATLRAEGLLPADPLIPSPLFTWPLRAGGGLTDPGYHGISNYVDLNAAYPNQLLDHNCGTRSYDLSNGYNHKGTDIFTWPWSWYKMDFDQVEVVAASSGVIVLKQDGHFDRSCGFNSNPWNAVYIQHNDGSVAWYGHLKSGSLTSKTVGQAVAQGEYLGVVGSSGSSTGPHLHLEVYDASNNLIDPWAGPCNSTTSSSWWAGQRPYFDPAVNAIRTHFATPGWGTCPSQEVLNVRDSYCGGQTVYFAAYYRDQLNGQVSSSTVRRPDNSVFASWNTTSPQYYAASWWWNSYVLPANPPVGRWHYEVTLNGITTRHAFHVGTQTPVISATGPTDLCSGGSVALKVARQPGHTYQWARNGTPIPNATDTMHTATLPGAYTCAATSSCSTITSVAMNVTGGSPLVRAVARLEGSYVANTGLMDDGLRSSGLLPLSEPYSGMGYPFMGGGGETTTPGVLALTGTNAIVDWVILELRSSVNPAIVLDARCGLLQRDGDVVAVDGTSAVQFNASCGDHHIAIRHRNHLPVMTLNPVALTSTPTTVDLTVGTTATYGTDARKAITGTFPTLALWAGDVTFNGQLKYAGGANDRDPILVRIGGLVPTATVNGYYPEDVNLNGQVKYAGSANDRDPILVNIGGTVPTAVRNAQLP